jgi:hypothetical protein
MQSDNGLYNQGLAVSGDQKIAAGNPPETDQHADIHTTGF